MNEKWIQIYDDYKKAKSALWEQKNCLKWQRDENTGCYYMWKAYYNALMAEEKEPLIFARILIMLAKEQNYKQSDYTRLHHYLLPAKEQYQFAFEAGLFPAKKELEQMNFEIDRLNYKFSCEDAPYDKQVAFIEGYEKLSDFEFHDSKVIFFSHDKNSATMELDYCDLTLKLLFEKIDDIHIDTNPVCDWINDFYCYPCFYNKNKLFFDIGFYQIICSKITVISIE